MARHIDISAEEVEIKPGNRDTVTVRVSNFTFDDPDKVLESLDEDDIPACPACEGTINPHAIRCPVCVAIMDLRKPTDGPVTGFTCSSCGTDVPLRAIRLLLETQPARTDPRREIATACFSGLLADPELNLTFNLTCEQSAEVAVKHADALITALRTIPDPNRKAT
jgi:hypothetical protein